MKVKARRYSFLSLTLTLALAVSALGYIGHWFFRFRTTDSYVNVLSFMPLSGAITFLFAAISLLCIEFESRVTASVLGTIIAFIGVSDFLQETVGVGVDFDFLISRLFYSDHQFHFYRLAPNSSLAFFFAGLSLVILAQKKTKEFSIFVANSLGGVSAGLGAVSLVGHWTGAVTAYTWQNFVGMSGHSAAMFLILGLSISLIALEKVSLKQRRIHAPLLIVLFMMMVTLQLYRSQMRAEKTATLEISREKITSLKEHIRRDIEEHAFHLKRSAETWSVNGQVKKSIWRADLKQLVDHLDGFTQICWVNNQGVSQWCEPDGQGPAFGQELSQLNSKLNSGFVLLPPAAHDLKFNLAVPVKRQGKPDGFFVGVLEFDQLFKSNYDFSNYNLELVWDAQVLFRAHELVQDASWTTSLALEAWGTRFDLLVTPLPHEIFKLQSKLPLIFLLIGIALSWAIAYASYLFIITREVARESQDLLAWEQAISKGSDLIFVTFDKQGLIRSFNPAAERFFEYLAAEVIDLKTPMIWHDPVEIASRRNEMAQKYNDPALSELQAILVKAKSGAVDRNEWTFITKSGHPKKGELSVHGLRSDRNELVGYVGIVRDVTFQREAEAKLIQSSKMASLGEMAGGIAHEINNPLTIIQGRVIRLLQLSERAEGVSVPELRDQMQIVIDTCRRIAKIVKGLSIFSRDSNLDLPEPAELDVIVQDTIELCRERFAENGVELKAPGVSDVIVTCRPTQISQVLLNLLNNAFDAVLNLESKWVQVEILSSAPGIVNLCITDSGSGIPREVVAKMMQPFFTTKEVGKGTGLGLSISKGIVESHGGKLYVDASSPHTRFVIELPAYRG